MVVVCSLACLCGIVIFNFVLFFVVGLFGVLLGCLEYCSFPYCYIYIKQPNLIYYFKLHFTSMEFAFGHWIQHF